MKICKTCLFLAFSRPYPVYDISQISVNIEADAPDFLGESYCKNHRIDAKKFLHAINYGGTYKRL